MPPTDDVQREVEAAWREARRAPLTVAGLSRFIAHALLLAKAEEAQRYCYAEFDRDDPSKPCPCVWNERAAALRRAAEELDRGDR